MRGDAAVASLHPSIDRLLAFVLLRLQPAATLETLASALARGAEAENAEQHLDDYTVLLDRYVDGPPLVGQVLRPGGLNEIKAANEMTDWILTFQAPVSSGAGSHALDRWRQTSSTAWLLAALSKAGPGDAEAATLIDTANRVPEDSPAFPSATYHAIRLLLAKGDRDRARVRLDGILPRARKEWPRSALNAELAERASLVANLDDFISVGLRQPAFFATTSEDREFPADVYDANDRRVPPGGRLLLTFSPDMTDVLNGSMSLPLFYKMATTTAVPVYLQRDLALVAWARAVMLDRPAIGDQAADIVARTVPALKLAASEYLRARDPAEKRFAFVMAALGDPGVSPILRGGLGRLQPVEKLDLFRDNWWCGPADPKEAPYIRSSRDVLGATASASDAPFPDKAERADARAEWAQIEAVGAGPNYLAREAVTYGRAHPTDPRVPEALAFAVRATRFGCTDKNTTSWSKSAFTLLHQKYPNTTWAKQTKYYY